MNNDNPFLNYPYLNNVSVPQTPQEPAAADANTNQNGTKNFVIGLAAGAAIAYLLTNKNLQKSIAAKGGQAWSAVRGEVEELKERLEDTQAELEYYRNLHKGE
jgi:uncharacterized membrane protein YebE (DUF533 family)